MVERKFQEVKADFGTPWKPEKKGDILEGKYMGFDVIPSQRGQSKSFKSFRIKPDGSNEVYGVAGATLERKLFQVPKGTFVRITYQGQITTANGQAHDFKIECEQGVKLLEHVSSDGLDLS